MINKMLRDVMKTFPLLRYACVGGIAFIVDWSVLYITTEFCQFHYLIGATLGFICGLIINYFLSVFWVFTNRSVDSRSVEVLMFTLIGMIGLLINDILLLLLTEQCAIECLKAKLLTTGIVFLWNYFARKNFIYKKKSKMGGITCRVRQFALSVLVPRG